MRWQGTVQRSSRASRAWPAHSSPCARQACIAHFSQCLTGHNGCVTCRRLGAAAAALAAGYVAAQGRRLSLAARRSCDAPNWLAHREPRAPRPVCALLLELLAAAEAEVVQLVDDGGARPAGSAPWL